MSAVADQTTSVGATGADRRATRRGRGVGRRPLGLTVVTGATLVFLFAPILVVIVFSFNDKRSLATFGGLSLEWYSEFAHDAAIRSSLVASVEIAIVVVVISAVLGTLLALGLRYARSRLATLSESLLLMTLVAPEIATAVAALLLFTQLGVPLSMPTIMVAQVTFSIVFVTMIVRSRLVGIDESLSEAAMDLGCSRLQAMRLVILPLLWPGIIAASLLVFVISFDNFVTSFFVSGIDVVPLPVRIYGMIKFGISPEINAVGTFMMMVTICLALLAVLVLRHKPVKHTRASGT